MVQKNGVGGAESTPILLTPSIGLGVYVYVMRMCTHPLTRMCTSAWVGAGRGQVGSGARVPERDWGAHVP